MCIRDHQNKVSLLVTGEAHRGGNGTRGVYAQVLLSLTNILQVHRRRKPGIAREVTPRECRATLAFIVVVLDELAVICVFNDFLHVHKYRLFFAFWNTKLPFLCRFYHFYLNLVNFSILEYKPRIPGIQEAFYMERILVILKLPVEPLLA